MKTQQYQLTVYLPDNANQPAVAARKDDAPPATASSVPVGKALSLREAALTHLGDNPSTKSR